MQRGDFNYEILIHDDASTDGTIEIIHEYEKKYPDIIKPVIQLENQYSKGVRGINFLYNFPRAEGKYIAMCEGDDYWTDPLKLQKQIDFMEANTDCSLCFHASQSERIDMPSSSIVRRPKEIPNDFKFELKDVILGGGGFVTTNSMFFLKEHSLENPKWKAESPAGDLVLTLLLALRGKVGYLDDVMSVYRVMSSSNSWSTTMKKFENYKKHHYAMIAMWQGFDEWTRYQHHSIVQKKIRFNKKQFCKMRIKRFLKKVFK